MPRTTSNPIDADRNAKERQRNQTLQKVIAAIGVELNMEHRRKQDFLEEALRQLQEYHKLKAAERTESILLGTKLNFLTIQLEKAKEEIARLQRLISSTHDVIQMQQNPIVLIQTAEPQPGATEIDADIFGPSNCVYEAEMFQKAQSQLVETSSIQKMTEPLTPLPNFPCATSDMGTMQTSSLENINELQKEVEMYPSFTASNSSTSTTCDQTTEEVSPSVDGSFEDSLTPAEVNMLKDLQEPEIDLLFGDNIDFLDFDQDTLPTSVEYLEASNPPSQSLLDPSYDINSLLMDPQYF